MFKMWLYIHSHKLTYLTPPLIGGYGAKVVSFQIFEIFSMNRPETKAIVASGDDWSTDLSHAFVLKIDDVSQWRLKHSHFKNVICV